MSDDQLLAEIRHDVKLCLKLLTGNGSPETGVVVRLDRLEQARKSQKWWGAFVLPSVFGLVFGAVAGYFKGGSA